MNTTDLVHFPPRDLPGTIATPPRSVLAPSRHELAAPVRSSILCAREYLAAEQRIDGSWAGRTTGEISSLNQLVLLYAFLDRERCELVEQAARAIRREQRAEGGWVRTPEGPFDLDASVLAYFALKLVGEDPCGPDLARARRAIRKHGGADRCDDSTWRWLALLGQIEYDLCEQVLPEWLLTSAFSQHAPLLDEVALAARSVVWTLRPRHDIELARGIRELFVESPSAWRQAQRNRDLPPRGVSGLWSRCERAGFVPFRRKALERATFLLTEDAVELPSDDVDFAELVWRWIALDTLGYADSSRAIQACERRLQTRIAVDDVVDEARFQPTTTLTADTSLAVRALLATGASPVQAVVADGFRWLVEHRAHAGPASGRPKELASLLEAVVAAARTEDPSSAALLPELRIAPEPNFDREENEDSISPSLELLRQYAEKFARDLILVQQPDGGWSSEGASHGARVTGINHGTLRHRGASAPETTGENLAALPRECHPHRSTAARAVGNLRATQRGDGSWNSATCARLICGTSHAIRGLIAAGVDARDNAVAAGANWLLVHQHESGGWGESAACSAGGTDFVPAEPAVIQTAWAIVALIAAGFADHEATRRGVQFLIDAQTTDGSWRDARLVERDSPQGPWYRNDLHSTSWALLALARWSVAAAGLCDASTTTLRLVCYESTI